MAFMLYLLRPDDLFLEIGATSASIQFWQTALQVPTASLWSRLLDLSPTSEYLCALILIKVLELGHYHVSLHPAVWPLLAHPAGRMTIQTAVRIHHARLSQEMCPSVVQITNKSSCCSSLD